MDPHSDSHSDSHSADPPEITPPARQDAVWSAKRDPSTGYGIAVFDVDPGEERGGETTITVRYFHAPNADPTNPNTGQAGAPNRHYTEFETFTLVRPRSDGRRHQH